MATAQVVETMVTDNNFFHNYPHTDNLTMYIQTILAYSLRDFPKQQSPAMLFGVNNRKYLRAFKSNSSISSHLGHRLTSYMYVSLTN